MVSLAALRRESALAAARAAVVAESPTAGTATAADVILELLGLGRGIPDKLCMLTHRMLYQSLLFL